MSSRQVTPPPPSTPSPHVGLTPSPETPLPPATPASASRLHSYSVHPMSSAKDTTPSRFGLGVGDIKYSPLGGRKASIPPTFGNTEDDGSVAIQSEPISVTKHTMSSTRKRSAPASSATTPSTVTTETNPVPSLSATRTSSDTQRIEGTVPGSTGDLSAVDDAVMQSPAGDNSRVSVDRMSVVEDVQGTEEDEEDESLLSLTDEELSTLSKLMQSLEVDISPNKSEEFGQLKSIINKVVSSASQTSHLREQLEYQRITINSLSSQLEASHQQLKNLSDKHTLDSQLFSSVTTALLSKSAKERKELLTLPPEKKFETSKNEKLPATDEKEDLEGVIRRWLVSQEEGRKLRGEVGIGRFKIKDQESQISSLSQELQFLRAAVLPSLANSLAAGNPAKVHKDRHPRHPMGDARTEHLFLAAKRVRARRAAGDYTFGAARPQDFKGLRVENRALAENGEPEYKPRQPKQQSVVQQTPGRGRKESSTARKIKEEVQSTPRGGGIEGLLIAAEVFSHTPGGTKVPVPRGEEVDELQEEEEEEESGNEAESEEEDGVTIQMNNSPKRRKTTPNGNWVKPSTGAVGGAGGGELALHASALDLLALATFSGGPDATPSAASISNSIPVSGGEAGKRLGGMMNSGADDGDANEDGGLLGPALVLNSPAGPSSSRASSYQPTASGSNTNPSPLKNIASARPGGHIPAHARSTGSSGSYPLALPLGSGGILTAPPTDAEEGEEEEDGSSAGLGMGPGRYNVLSSSMPARRVRSPYLKWSADEDELLARGVAKYGQKWDLVSKVVPTRSYHQCRQRWLRKLGVFDHKPEEGKGDKSAGGSTNA